MAGGPLYFSMVEVMKAKPPAKSRAGQRRLISLVASDPVAFEFRKGYGGRDGLDPGVKRSVRSCRNTPSLANTTRIIQPKLIITGIYTCICNSVCRPKGGFAIVPPDAPTLEEPSSSSEVFRLQLR